MGAGPNIKSGGAMVRGVTGRRGFPGRRGGGAFPGGEKAEPKCGGGVATRLKGPDLGGTRSRFWGKVEGRKVEAGKGTERGGGGKRGRIFRDTRN